MKASDMLRHNNGLKTTQSVLNKQQSGVDAANKVAQTQAPVFTQQQLDAAGKKVDKTNAATPTDDAMKAARAKTIATQQAIANGVDVNQGVPSDEEDKPSVPIVKKEEPAEQPKQLSYADMYKILNPEQQETAEQRANREKKERTKARIAALGDGLRALSNIYFATKGAKVVHNPESDMTKAVNKRKAYMDAQREKNRASWLAGYQRALALDEEARKNNLTLAEQMRYHDNLDRVNSAKVMLDQMRIAQQDEYNNGKLRNQEFANKETVRHHKEQESTSKKNADANVTRAQKAGKNKGGSSKENYNKTLAGLTAQDPNGVRVVTRSLKRAGVPQNAQTIVEAYRAQKGSTSNNSRAKQLAKKYGF
jgi:hypothetical protein